MESGKEVVPDCSIPPPTLPSPSPTNFVDWEALKTQEIPSFPTSSQHGAYLYADFAKEFKLFPAQCRALFQVCIARYF